MLPCRRVDGGYTYCVRGLSLIFALLVALGAGNLPPWLLSHCADVPAVARADACCPAEPTEPTEPAPVAPTPDTCTFCAAVVVAPDNVLRGDGMVAPAVQPTPVLLQLSLQAAPPATVAVAWPPSGGTPRHVILLI